MDTKESMVCKAHERQCSLSSYKVMTDKSKKKNAEEVVKEQYISIGYNDQTRQEQRLKLRRITFKTCDGKVYVFLTNNFKLPASEVALVYKNRWMIESLFKRIKQNFPLPYFWGESENSIKMQVYFVLIAQLRMVVIRKKAATKKSFAT
jgi:IS4 transposase